MSGEDVRQIAGVVADYLAFRGDGHDHATAIAVVASARGATTTEIAGTLALAGEAARQAGVLIAARECGRDGL